MIYETEIPARLLRSIRGTCNNLDGYSREEAQDMYRPTAIRLEMRVDDLIDAAMGPAWEETPAIHWKHWGIYG